jgi:tetratricopeptide (TPR) repeat protein
VFELTPVAAQAVKSLGAPVAKSLTGQLARRIAAGNRTRRLRLDKDTREFEAALVVIVKDSVGDAVTGLFTDVEEQESYRRGLLDQDRDAWPLVNGSYPADLVAETRDWVAPLLAPVDEDGVVPPVRADHPLVEALAAGMLAKLQHWAVRAGGSPVTPLWLAFVAEVKAAELLDAGKFPPRLEDLRAESLFDALQFKYRVVPYLGAGPYSKYVENTLAWVRSEEAEPGLAVGVVTGAGGTGKSRLAAEVCDRLAVAAPHWQAGFVDYAQMPTASMPQQPLLLVCDYPERHPDRVGAYLARLWQYQREERLQVPVRVLLVSRHQDMWVPQIKAKIRNLDALTTHCAHLAPGQLDAEALTGHAQQAFTAFCDGYGITRALRPAFTPDLDNVDRPLLAHIAGLLTARKIWEASGETTSDLEVKTWGHVELLDGLIDAEIDRLGELRIDGRADRPLVFNSAAEVRQALCVTTLTAPARCDLPQLLTNADAFKDRGSLGVIADTLLKAFPATAPNPVEDPYHRSIAPVEPDLIAAHLLSRTPGRSELVKRLVTSETVAQKPAYHAQLIDALSLAADDYEAIAKDLKAHLADSLSALTGAGATTADSLAALLSERLMTMVHAAVAAAGDQDLIAARQLAAALELPAPGSEHSIDRAAAKAYRVLPYLHPGLSGLGVALTRRALAHHERSGNTVRIAAASDTLGLWLGDHGQRPEALAAAERAVALREEMVGQDRAAYLPALACSVNNLAIRLADAGRREESLAAAQRAVDLHDELAMDNRAVNLPDLANTVNNLAVRLVGAGRWEEAMATAKRAVELYQELAADNPSFYLPHLAGSMNNLAGYWAEVGRWDKALAAAGRAVDLRDTLVTGNRAAHLPDLATSVNNLAVYLAEAGRRDEALAAAQRAVDLRNELATDNRAAHLSDLARSYWTAARVRCLLEVEVSAGIEWCDRAIELYRELVVAEPDAFGPYLETVEALRAKLSAMPDEHDAAD